MGRSLVSAVAAIGLIFALAGSVAAVKPQRGCPDGFEQLGVYEFRAYLTSSAFYDSLSPEGQALAPELLVFVEGDAFLEAGLAYDRNGDEELCLKQNPPTKGNLYGWVFNAVDNTANH